MAPRDPQATVNDIVDRNVAAHPGRWSRPQIDQARITLLRSYTVGIDEHLKDSERTLRRNLDMLGLLSLSEAPDDLLMWAHYAENHYGFVIEFDTTRSPLLQRPGETGWQGLPVPVTYQATRPQVYCDSLDLVLPDELVRLKATAWSYEREWRVIRDRETADRTISAAGAEVSLFTIDPDAIVSIRLGKDATATTETRIRDIIAGAPQLSHVHVSRASLSHQGTIVFS